MKNKYTKIIMQQLLDVVDDFKKSKNIMHTAILHKNVISGVFASLTLFFGLLGFIFSGVNIFDALLGTIPMFGLNFPENAGSSFLLFLASISATITIFFVAAVFFMKDYFDKKLVDDAFAKDYTAVFGLSDVNRYFLSCLNADEIANTIIIESDPNNQFINF